MDSTHSGRTSEVRDWAKIDKFSQNFLSLIISAVVEWFQPAS